MTKKEIKCLTCKHCRADWGSHPGLRDQSTKVEYLHYDYSKGICKHYRHPATECDWYESNKQMDFGHAITALKAGARVTREGWNGKGMWLELQKPDEHSKMTLPYIYMKTADNNLVPWLASQTDMLSEDWILLDGEEAEE